MQCWVLVQVAVCLDQVVVLHVDLSVTEHAETILDKTPGFSSGITFHSITSTAGGFKSIYLPLVITKIQAVGERLPSITAFKQDTLFLTCGSPSLE